MIRDDITDLADAIRPILARRRVLSASVFGSLARGQATADSDVDLLIECAPGTDLFDLVDLKDELEARLGRAVDLAVPKYLKPRLRDRVLAEAIPIL